MDIVNRYEIAKSFRESAQKEPTKYGVLTRVLAVIPLSTTGLPTISKSMTPQKRLYVPLMNVKDGGFLKRQPS